MYREPSPSSASKSSAAIKDPSASARSTIRRQATIRRPSRYARNARGGSFRSHSSRHGANNSGRDSSGIGRHAQSPISIDSPEYADLEYVRRMADRSSRMPSRRGRHAQSSVSIDSPEYEDFQYLRRMADMGSRVTSRRASPSALDQPGRQLRIARESALRPDISHSLLLGDLLNQPPPENGLTDRQSPDHISFTPRFAPAMAYHRSTSPRPPLGFSRLPSFAPLDGPRDDDTAAPNPPLSQRAGLRSANRGSGQSREPVVDGLGDRERSLGPDDENDAWDTLLTTITPDANLPSANSSFASGITSSTAERPRVRVSRSPVTSSQTLPSSLDSSATTVPMVLDPYPEYLNPCDYPSSSDGDTESDSEANYRALYRRSRDRLHRSHHHLGSTMGSQPPIPTISVSFTHATANPELQRMQAILNRLSRREDVPDDWWAAAGLPRTMSRRAQGGSHGAETPDGPLGQRF